jgi:hypothetical protein
MVGEESHENRLRAAVASSGIHTMSGPRGRCAMRTGRPTFLPLNAGLDTAMRVTVSRRPHLLPGPHRV